MFTQHIVMVRMVSGRAFILLGVSFVVLCLAPLSMQSLCVGQSQGVVMGRANTSALPPTSLRCWDTIIVDGDGTLIVCHTCCDKRGCNTICQ